MHQSVPGKVLAKLTEARPPVPVQLSVHIIWHQRSTRFARDGWNGSDQHQTLAACKSQSLKVRYLPKGQMDYASPPTTAKEARRIHDNYSQLRGAGTYHFLRNRIRSPPPPLVGSTIMLQKSIVSCPTMTGTPLARKSAVSRGPDPPHVRRPPHLTASTIPKRRHLGEYRWPREKGGEQRRGPPLRRYLANLHQYGRSAYLRVGITQGRYLGMIKLA